MDTNYELDRYDHHFHRYFSYDTAKRTASKLLDRMETEGWLFSILKSYNPGDTAAVLTYYFELVNYELDLCVYPNSHVFFTCRSLSGVSDPNLSFEVVSQNPNLSVKMYLSALTNKPKEK